MKFFAPLNSRFRFALKGNTDSGAFISSLFRSATPLTVIRRISSMVIEPFNRMAWRGALAHVGKKILKGVPSLANRNATPSVIRKRAVGRIVAPISHVSPNAVFSRSAQSMREVKGCDCMSAAGTSARCSIAANQIVGRRLAFSAALTSAPPVGFLFALVTQIAEDNQVSVAKMCAINKTEGVWNRLKFNAIFVAAHSIYSLIVNVWVRPCGVLVHFAGPYSLYHSVREVD